MNFKLLMLLFMVTACGVKGDPVAPKDHKLPSLLDNYEDITVDQNLNDTKKK